MFYIFLGDFFDFIPTIELIFLIFVSKLALINGLRFRTRKQRNSRAV